ncbi:Nucleolar GTP-binding protein 2 [Aphelenchoides bicaudatus]|nr:Nucleolar GTP-binding protein 2 [Aphelenchoides bicaudatus]
MSFSEIEQGVPLQDSDIFLHSPILKPQIEKFRDNFERNQRHREFDGLIRRNHRIYEANDLFPHLKVENLGKLLENLNKVDQRLKLLTEIKFTPNELSKVDLSNLSQMDVMKLAEAKLQECTPVERLDMANKRKSLKGTREGAGSSGSKAKSPAGGVQKRTRSNHSLNPDRKAPNAGPGTQMRSKATINRLQMYRNFKPIRNAKGKIIKAAPFQGWLNSGTVARVEPHRKWFGNTKVIGQEQLQKFQENMGKVLNDPFQVVLRQTRLPISLLQEKAKQQRVHITETESFEHTFGKKSLRKKPNIQINDLEEMCKDAERRTDEYKKEDDRSLLVNQEVDERQVNQNPLFRAGRSNRVWGELYKVLDSSDVVVQLIWFPTWVTKKWLSILQKEIPTIAFHASIQHSFGKGSLINVLRQFRQLHKDRKQISVGFIGYPNVGKSSVVNTLRKKKVCKAAPLAGETKYWQYVTLMKKIFLIDCPGVVYPQGDSETQLILKGVVRVENVTDPENHIQGVLDRVRPEYLRRHYGMDKPDVDDKWTDVEDFLTKIALMSGRLLKGGEPDLSTVSKMVLNDFQRGKLPFYTLPAGCKDNSVFGDNEAPINEVEEDEKAIVTDGETDAESEAGDKVSDDDEVKEENVSDEEEYTDLESNCSGLTDISGLSDVGEQLMTDELPEGMLRIRRPRGVRGGKKFSEKKKRMEKLRKKQMVKSIVNDSGSAKIVDFTADRHRNMWFKKLQKRRKPKHQV